MYYVMQQLTLPYALCTDVREYDAHTHILVHCAIVHNYWFYLWCSCVQKSALCTYWIHLAR